ncbi:helix-turn-helix domain-containing protein [Bradyrhizobium sp. 26S5]|uniref:helix-turn-helix domain-containing protein n=1 Tax=Bradyrhizobium sp. 26S5 TaxID=3139729 RepID=UPI0030CD1ACD
MKLTYSVKEVCGLLSVGRTTLYTLIADGKLTVIKVGRRTLISARSIEAFLGTAEGTKKLTHKTRSCDEGAIS